MRKPNSTFLWMLTLSLFVPLATLADDQRPTLTLDQMTPAQRAAYLQKLEQDDKRLQDAAFNNTLAVTPDAASLQALRERVAADRETATQTRDNERELSRAGATIPTDIKTWDALKKLIPDVKLVYDRAAGADYTASVHLEGSIPVNCADKIGNNELVTSYDGSSKIESIDKTDAPFRGWNFKTSDAAQECVDQFLKDRKEKKASGYCRTDKFPQGVECISLRAVTMITNLAGGPKVGVYSCEGDGSDCEIEFYGAGKSESDVKRVADSDVYNSAKRRIDTALGARRTNLALWKIKNVDQCYGNGNDQGKKKKSLADFFSDVASVKSKLKDKEDLSPYVKKGLTNEINRLKALAESGRKVSELPTLASEIAAFYTKYLATSRSDVKDPDLELMRRTTLQLFKTMERRVLDDESALKNPDSARVHAEQIISQAISLAPDDINLKNELEAGIKIDTTVLRLERRQVAFERLKQQCLKDPYNCDQVRLQSMYIGLVKAQQQAAQYYQKLQVSAYKQCMNGRKRSSDPFDDEGLVVDSDGGDDDEVTFTSRCDAAKDNLNRVWRRLQESNSAVQNAAGPDTRIIAQIAQGITGGNNLPNATIQPGQNGYNPALAYALDPNRFPGNFSSEFLRSLAPTLTPSAAIGAPTMCLTTTGQTGGCWNNGNQVVVRGADMPPALPRI